MTKISLTAAALIACLAACAICVVPALAAKETGTTLKVKYKEADAGDPYGMSEFKGTVGPKKCAQGRTVKIKGVGSEKTDSKGKFELTLSGPADPGKYKVSVAAKGSCTKVKATLTIK